MLRWRQVAPGMFHPGRLDRPRSRCWTTQGADRNRRYELAARGSAGTAARCAVGPRATPSTTSAGAGGTAMRQVLGVTLAAEVSAAPMTGKLSTTCNRAESLLSVALQRVGPSRVIWRGLPSARRADRHDEINTGGMIRRGKSPASPRSQRQHSRCMWCLNQVSVVRARQAKTGSWPNRTLERRAP